MSEAPLVTPQSTHRGPPKIVRLLALVAVVALLAFLLVHSHRNRSTSADGPIRASGIVEARTIEIASEISGTVIERPSDKGQAVRVGDLVAVVASDTSVAALNQAQAALQAARDQALRAEQAVGLQQATAAGDIAKAGAQTTTATARYGDVKAGPRAQEIEAARAAVAQAAAARQAASAQLAQLQAGLRPEEIKQAEAAYEAATAGVATARARLADLEAGARPQEIEAARAQVAKAEAGAVKADRDYTRAKALLGQGAIAASQLDAFRAASEAGQADLKAAREQLKLALAGSRTEQVTAARTQVQQAVAQQQSAQQALALARKGPRSEEIARAAAAVRQAQGAHEAAQANLKLALAGSRPGQVSTAHSQVREAQAGLQLARANAGQVALRRSEAQAARAQVAQAQAAVEAAQANLNKFTIRAPAAGMIDDTHVRVGEVVRPGSSLATMVDFSDTWVTVYVTEPQLPRVTLGQAAEVSVDGLPGRAFGGTIRRIASQAEFTPKFVQTLEERTRTVFAVEISVPNEDKLLKPGMPADAVIGAAGTPGRPKR